MDEKILGGIANARFLAFGIDDESLGLSDIELLVCVNIANPIEVLDHGDMAVLGHKAYEAFSASRYDALHLVVQFEKRV